MSYYIRSCGVTFFKQLSCYFHKLFVYDIFKSMAYMLSGNMDRGAPEYQIEAAISKVFASVSMFDFL